MIELKILSTNQWNFSFELDDRHELHIEHMLCTCNYCKVTRLDPVYVYIINSLQEGGLLDENYKLICCFCAVLKEFGLLDLINDLVRLTYDDVLDILILKFMFCERGDIYYVRFYIHDYSKINHWN